MYTSGYVLTIAGYARDHLHTTSTSAHQMSALGSYSLIGLKKQFNVVVITL